MCSKIRYDSTAEARRRNPAKCGRPYRCKECGGAYHVGHKRTRKIIAKERIDRFKEGFSEILRLIDIICGG